MKVKNPVDVSKLSISDRAYLAGIIDGEGTICATRTISAVRSHKWRVSVANTSRVLIEWLRSIGGTVVERKPHGPIKTNKPVFEWQVQDEEGVIAICEAVIPYLRTKDDAARLALKETQAHRQARNKARGSSRPCSSCGKIDVEFSRNGKYRRSQCKSCCRAYQTDYYKRRKKGD